MAESWLRDTAVFHAHVIGGAPVALGSLNGPNYGYIATWVDSNHCVILGREDDCGSHNLPFWNLVYVDARSGARKILPPPPADYVYVPVDGGTLIQISQLRERYRLRTATLPANEQWMVVYRPLCVFKLDENMAPLGPLLLREDGDEVLWGFDRFISRNLLSAYFGLGPTSIKLIDVERSFASGQLVVVDSISLGTAHITHITCYWPQKLVVGVHKKSIISINRSGEIRTLSHAPGRVSFFESSFLVQQFDHTEHYDLWQFLDDSPGTLPTHCSTWKPVPAAVLQNLDHNQSTGRPKYRNKDVDVWFPLAGDLVIASKDEALAVVDLTSGRTLISLSSNPGFSWNPSYTFCCALGKFTAP
ncbi:hypothetical protein Pelo_18635 [Pelomyxa schiedti]|nr:hypothetical protein Pelo_18635 [Pelomyxa schiedti]